MSEQERQYSRCEKCSKRLAYLGAPLPRPCPDEAASPAECREVRNSLMSARVITKKMGNELHPETHDLMAVSGWTLEALDAALAQQERTQADRRFFTDHVDNKDAVAAWIDGNSDRALIVAKWALDQIDITANGTRTLGSISVAASDIARDIGEHAANIADQDWEFDHGVDA